MLHGVWVAVFAIALVGLIEMIPLAAPAGLLVVVGGQLVRPADVRTAHRHGELALYAVTAVGVLMLTLLEGVAIGLVVAGLLVLRRAVRARVRLEKPAAGPLRVVVEGTLSFLSVPALSRVLAAVPAGPSVRVNLAVDYLDHAAHDHLDAWTARQRATGAWVQVSEPAHRRRSSVQGPGPGPGRSAAGRKPDRRRPWWGWPPSKER